MIGLHVEACELMEASIASEESPRVLVVDDEKVIREILSDFLTMEGYVVRTVEDGAQALTELERRSYNLVISDLKMPGMGGLELLERIDELKVNIVSVIMTGFGTVETAIEAMKKGAYDYILKPFKIEEVVRVVQRGLEKQRLAAENLRLREAVSLYKVSEAIAASLSLEEVLATVGDTALLELNADLVSTWLEDGEGGYFERQRLVQARGPDGGPRLAERRPGETLAPPAPEWSDEPRGELGTLSRRAFIEHYAAHPALLEQGVKGVRFFEAPPA